MANFLRGGGLRFLNSLHGGASSTRQMVKDASQNLAVFIGDVVAREADTNIAPFGNLTPGTTAPDGVSQDYGAVSTLTNHLVIVDPFAVFEAQAGATGLVAADEGFNANIIASAGVVATQLSGHLVDDSTENTTNTLDLHLKEFLRISDNDEGAYSRWAVVFNRHRLHSLMAGV